LSPRRQDDNHFRNFAGGLEQAIAKYGETPEGELIIRQRAQVEKLVSLEKEFRRTLISHYQGPAVYKAFVKYIRDVRRNTLDARPFFRERQKIFTKSISKALERRADKSLYRFHFNYQFVLFALKSQKWRPNSKVVQLAKQIRQIRTELIEMNMPLAISRARIFWSRTPKAHLSYMDLIQISSEGLMSAVDKFCLPYSTAFRDVAIGRMVGNFIEQYSETMIHFFPKDKRKIYRANKIMRLFGENPDWEKIMVIVNKEVDISKVIRLYGKTQDWALVIDELGKEPDTNHKIGPDEIANLMAASSTVSADAPLPGQENEVDIDDSRLPLDGFRAPEDTHPDVRVEMSEALTVMGRAIHELALKDRKLLKMKGVSL
jgi:DNA-directed RNA polymerase specialized sigma subunit